MSETTRYLDEESSFTGRYSKDVFESLYFAYRPMIGRILLLTACGFLGRLLLLSNANLVGIWVDTFCWSQKGQFGGAAQCHSVPELFKRLSDDQFLMVMLFVTLLGFILTAVFRIWFSCLSAMAVSRFYDEVTMRTSRLPLKFFDTNPVGRIVTRFSSDYGNVFRLFGGPLAEFFAIVFDLVGMLMLITLASPLYLPLFFAVGVANYLVYRFARDRLRTERRNLSAWRSPSIAHFAETTQGAPTIRIFGRQATFLKRFANLNDRYLNQRIKATSAITIFSMKLSFLTAILLLLTGIIGYWLTRKGLLTIGSIGVAFTFVVFSGATLQMFFEWFAQFEEAMTGVERLNDYLRRDLEPGSRLPAARVFATKHPVYQINQEENLRRSPLVAEKSASVVAEDLWFRYSPELPYVLKGVDFSIRPGEKIGIVGRTGSGKTSLVQALFHLYPFERGRIFIDGHGANVDRPSEGAATTDLGVFRRSVALISQEPALFRGTIRENLDLIGTHSEDELLAALDRVGLREWLAAQSNGLHSAIEERGRNLSAGEKQLLCMARCLLQDAPVIVMDEATSAVDPQTEEILVRATREFFSDRTQIIIAHRLSTLIHCDRILWLHKGEVRMFDRPSKLLPVFQSTQLV